MLTSPHQLTEKGPFAQLDRPSHVHTGLGILETPCPTLEHPIIPSFS